MNANMLLLLWSCTERDEPVLTIVNHGFEGRITGVYWMPLNKAILATGGDGTMKLFDPKVKKEKKTKNFDDDALSDDPPSNNIRPANSSQATRSTLEKSHTLASTRRRRLRSLRLKTTLRK